MLTFLTSLIHLAIPVRAMQPIRWDSCPLLSFVLGIVISIGAVPWSHAQIVPRTVVLRNEDAPGTEERFSDIGGASISEDSEVGFFANLTHTGMPQFSKGMWSEIDGELTLIARAGDIPAEYPNVTTGFNFFGRPPIVYNGGQLAFGAGLNNIGGAWRGGPSDDLTAEVYRDVSAPGTAPGTLFSVTSEKPLRANATGAISTAAYLKQGTGDATAANDFGLWSGPTGSLQLVAREGSAAPEVPGATFADFDYPVLNDGGRLAFSASLQPGSGGVVANDNDGGIWQGAPGALDLVVRKGAVAPDVDGDAFREFRQMSINNDDKVAFTAQVFPSNRTGLWTVDGDDMNTIAVPGDAIPGYANTTLSVPYNPVINGSGAVAFSVGLEGEKPDGLFNTGIMVYHEGESHLLARTGAPVPGTNGTATFVANGGNDMVPFMSDAGIVVFQSTIAIDGILGARDAILAYDLDGNFLTKIMYGDEFEVAPGDIRSILHLSLPVEYDQPNQFITSGSGGQDGRISPLNSKGELVFHAKLGLYDEGIFVITVPEPSSAFLAIAGCLGLFAARRKLRT